MSVKNKNLNLTNLASPKIGTKIIEVSDDFFGEASRMLDDKEPVFIEDKYDEHGKWMDGWESKRRRDGGNDWAIIELGSPGIITEIDVDTSFFTGNFPPFASIEGLYSDQKPSKDSDWIEILPKTSLKGDSGNKFKIEFNTSYCISSKISSSQPSNSIPIEKSLQFSCSSKTEIPACQALLWKGTNWRTSPDLVIKRWDDTFKSETALKSGWSSGLSSLVKSFTIFSVTYSPTGILIAWIIIRLMDVFSGLES